MDVDNSFVFIVCCADKSRTRTVSEEDTRSAVRIIGNGAETFRSDYQDIFFHSRLDERFGNAKRINESGTGCRDVKRRDFSEPEFGRYDGCGRGHAEIIG